MAALPLIVIEETATAESDVLLPETLGFGLIWSDPVNAARFIFHCSYRVVSFS